MTAEAAALVRSFPVGRRTCTMTIQRPEPGGVTSVIVEWTPTVPNQLSRRELNQYRRGRDEAMAALARELGAELTVLEV